MKHLAAATNRKVHLEMRHGQLHGSTRLRTRTRQLDVTAAAPAQRREEKSFLIRAALPSQGCQRAISGRIPSLPSLRAHPYIWPTVAVARSAREERILHMILVAMGAHVKHAESGVPQACLRSLARSAWGRDIAG